MIILESFTHVLAFKWLTSNRGRLQEEDCSTKKKHLQQSKQQRSVFKDKMTEEFHNKKHHFNIKPIPIILSDDKEV